jgi:uncharacterized protein
MFPIGITTGITTTLAMAQPAIAPTQNPWIHPHVIASNPAKPAPPSRQSLNATLKTAVEKVIAAEMQTQNMKVDEQKIDADYVDLNGDSTLDAIVILSGSYWCGTGGCTMLVFTGQGSTFKLLSRSSLVRPPLTVAETKTKGFRDLILDVSGGGMPAKKVALKFDSTGYPENPSDQPALPKNAKILGKVLFPPNSQPQTIGSLAPASSPSTKPSFDCKKADGEVENLICKDSQLATLDLKLADAYQKALKALQNAPAQDLANLKAEQIGWVKGRNDCWKAQGASVRNCVQRNYIYRIAELQANFALVPSQKPIFFTCNNNPANEVVATFYQTDPATARLERGDTVITAFLRGSQYEGQNVTFAMKNKTASIEWRGEKLQCQAK